MDNCSQFKGVYLRNWMSKAPSASSNFRRYRPSPKKPGVTLEDPWTEDLSQEVRGFIFSKILQCPRTRGRNQDLNLGGHNQCVICCLKCWLLRLNKATSPQTNISINPLTKWQKKLV
ncbi:hypothetical protein CMV_018893 [Castanea mollissima]|uniref:Uncharacterized protein n=1 Tax=Castanea mollissima TaxID=60419 RepID=A0A8J4VNA9_9ROSI|nr:hypothetical protein CMV_018893 [Castanea mollissima]